MSGDAEYWRAWPAHLRDNTAIYVKLLSKRRLPFANASITTYRDVPVLPALPHTMIVLPDRILFLPTERVYEVAFPRGGWVERRRAEMEHLGEAEQDKMIAAVRLGHGRGEGDAR